MLNLGCDHYIRNPFFFQDFGVKSGGEGCVFLWIIHGCIRYIQLAKTKIRKSGFSTKVAFKTNLDCSFTIPETSRTLF